MVRDIRISIIIPVFNSGEYLRRSLDSCVYQTMREIEVIAVWDRSPDIRDKKIIQEYEQEYPDMVRGIHHEQNLGAGEARNTGIREARGRFIMFCDSDDFLELNACQTMYEAACTGDADLVVCDYYYLRDSVIGTRTVNKGIDSAVSNQRPYHLDKATIWVMLVAKTLIEEQALYFTSHRIGEDCVCVFWYMAAKKIVKVSLPLYYYVYRKSSLIGSMSEQASTDLADAYIGLLDNQYYSSSEDEEKRAVCYSIFRRFFGYWLERIYQSPQGDFYTLFLQLLTIKNTCKDFYSAARDMDYHWETRRMFAILRFIEKNLESADSNARFREFYTGLDMSITKNAFLQLGEELKEKRVVLWAAGSYGRIHQVCLQNTGISFEMTDINAEAMDYLPWDDLKYNTDVVLVSSSEFMETVIQIVTSQDKTNETLAKEPIETWDLQAFLNKNCELVRECVEEY